MAGSKIAGSFLTGYPWQGQAVYGTEGIASPSNTPGSRDLASGWSDSQGNLWLFGGQGVVSAPGAQDSIAIGNMDDLWKFSNGMWTWMAGSDQVSQAGTYGTLGTSASDNTPGSRTGAAAWTDAAGNLWLFGGNGVGASTDDCDDASFCVINDLWKYTPPLNEWTWMGGPDVPNQPGVFGSRGVASPQNVPPPRNNAVTWTDPSGNFWLFGGLSTPYEMNDLWKYSNGEWTWMSGAQQQCELGVYGTLGTASAANVPGARDYATGWTDKSGNLWLFGGNEAFCFGNDSSMTYGNICHRDIAKEYTSLSLLATSRRRWLRCSRDHAFAQCAANRKERFVDLLRNIHD
jgi:hypothetical protein